MENPMEIPMENPMEKLGKCRFLDVLTGKIYRNIIYEAMVLI